MSIKRRLCLTIATVILTGCATLQAPQSDFSPKSHDEAIFRPAARVLVPEQYVSDFALPALFATTVYRKDMPDPKVRAQDACNYLGQSDHRDVLLNMPQGPRGDGWFRSSQAGYCASAGGLAFETYLHHGTDNRIDMAFIAIRGTENDSLGQVFHDWGANLSGIFSFGGGEYRLAQRLVLPVINNLWEGQGSNGLPGQPRLPIYLAGHSLGGGIAQYIAYLANDKVKETFTFDSSPVTHWMQLTETEQARDPVIHRLYMHKEFLSYVRKISTFFNTTRFQRDDYEFFFVDQNLISAHSMSHFACQLAARVNENGEKFAYTVEAARKTLGDPILCPNPVRNAIPPSLLTAKTTP